MGIWFKFFFNDKYYTFIYFNPELSIFSNNGLIETKSDIDLTSNSDLDREQNNEFENNSQIKGNKEELSNDTNYNLPKINLLEKFENKEFKQSILFLNKNNSYFLSEYNEKKIYLMNLLFHQ